MTTTDKTKAGRRRAPRAVVLAAAVEQVQEPIASTSDIHGVAEATRLGGEDKSADDVIEDAGSSSIPVGNRAPVGEGVTGTGAPRETRRQGRRAKRRPDTKAFASSPSTKLPASKNARIAELVSRSEGAGIDELTVATGWQRHTVRAAITRLRQSGFTVELRTGEDGRRAYHHAASTEGAS